MTLISRVSSDQYDAADTGSVASAGRTVAQSLLSVATESARHDGSGPLDEATLLSLRHHGLDGKALWVAREGDAVVGFALASAEAPTSDASGTSDPVEVNLVVAPTARGAGLGRALAEAVLAAFPGVPLNAWSHGNHPAAARLGEALGFSRVRDLWVMRRPLDPAHPLPEITPAAGVAVRPFRPGQDEDAFLALNAEAFAGHPEQGSMTRADLDERMAEPWFDAEGFFLAEPADAPTHEANLSVESPSLLGFHWTKVHLDQDPPVGEVYVVGISPAAQGRGLGRLLTLTGLHHLAARGLPEVILYVEADNAPAVAVYAGLGFTHAEQDTHVMWSRPSGGG